MNNIFQHNLFEWTTRLESKWLDIKEEMSQVSSGQPTDGRWFLTHPHYVDSKSEKAWRTFSFFFFGIQDSMNCQKCPKTAALLSEIPGLITAQFSVLAPNTRIESHKGYSRMIIRSHLALKIPSKELCKLKVEEEEYSWSEGVVVSFDDSKEHEAWNLTDETRVVLMIDVTNPEYPYTAEEICRYKLEKIADPFLLEIADQDTWLKWLEQGRFE